MGSEDCRRPAVVNLAARVGDRDYLAAGTLQCCPEQLRQRRHVRDADSYYTFGDTGALRESAAAYAFGEDDLNLRRQAAVHQAPKARRQIVAGSPRCDDNRKAGHRRTAHGSRTQATISPTGYTPNKEATEREGSGDALRRGMPIPPFD